MQLGPHGGPCLPGSCVPRNAGTSVKCFPLAQSLSFHKELADLVSFGHQSLFFHCEQVKHMLIESNGI